MNAGRARFSANRARFLDAHRARFLNVHRARFLNVHHARFLDADCGVVGPHPGVFGRWPCSRDHNVGGLLVRRSRYG